MSAKDGGPAFPVRLRMDEMAAIDTQGAFPKGGIFSVPVQEYVRSDLYDEAIEALKVAQELLPGVRAESPQMRLYAEQARTTVALAIAKAESTRKE